MTSANKQVSVVISRDGPYIVSGNAPLTEEIIGANAEGESMQWQRGKAYDAPAKYALCRCGQSAKAPFCDGTHARVGFDGTEMAPRTAYAQQPQIFDGPDLSLMDARHLCAGLDSGRTHRRSQGAGDVFKPGPQLPGWPAPRLR